MLYISSCASPLGNILLHSDGESLTGLWFEGQKHAPKHDSNAISADDLPIFAETRQWLDSYFKGEKTSHFPRILLKGTPFQMLVWQHLTRIPYGSTLTYGAIARRIATEMGLKSMSAQAVGNAVGRNPISIIVPCHRIIGSTGSLTGYAGGIERKEWLLRLEGCF